MDPENWFPVSIYYIIYLAERGFLARLYTAVTFFGGRFTELSSVQAKNEVEDKDAVDLVEVGLASLRYIGSDDGAAQLIKVNEPLSVEVIKEVIYSFISPRYSILLHPLKTQYLVTM